MVIIYTPKSTNKLKGGINRSFVYVMDFSFMFLWIPECPQKAAFKTASLPNCGRQLTLVISTLKRRLSQENYKLEINQGYIVRYRNLLSVF